MSELSGYKLGEVIHEGKHTIVYRAVRLSDQAPVIIKVLSSEYPSAEQLAKFRQEYEIARGIEGDGIVRPLALENYANGLALVLEDFEGVSLKEIIKSHRISTRAFLTIARKIAAALGQIHAHGVIHKDIKPHNIIINSGTGKVKITDFGISTMLSRENPDVVAPNMLEGTLAYISPEQTGRMNRAIDNRTDFYSAGVTFYEMLTGRTPFEDTGDAMELIHSHIAVEPPPPSALSENLESTLSDIVMKLLSKNAEDRYQSGFGLRADLDQCLRFVQNGEAITPFALGTRDVSDKFQIPEKLYGREGELKTLLEAFERASGGPVELMLVTGQPGIGKSALINEVQRPLVESRGYFTAGKFDQFKRDVPYSAITQAFSDLVRQILTESEGNIEQVRIRLKDALGDSGKVITNIIPDLELILGKQKAVEELPAAEAENRFNNLFMKFVRCFALKKQPLVIFLDDLQWADGPSLRLLNLILSDTELRYMLLIAAYRDSEIDAHHPLIQMVGDLNKNNVPVKNIALGPLGPGSVGQLVADTISVPVSEAEPLAAVVLQKTNGNPFFTNEFLKTLYQENLLNFDTGSGKWTWDVARLNEARMTDNVVELMSAKIKKLPESAQKVLKVAACIGSQFDLRTLSMVMGESPRSAALALREPIKEGLILPLGTDYKYAESAEGSEAIAGKKIVYKFLHDRVQQASYDSLEDSEREGNHYTIGRHLLDSLSETEREEQIVTIVNHLNLGAERIESPDERLGMAQLNLSAASRARASTAYEPALRYINFALDFLPEKSWKTQYDLALKIYTEAVGLRYLNGDFEGGESLADEVIKQARDVLDKVPVYRLKIPFYNARQEYEKALDTATYPILRELGVKLPRRPIEALVPVYLMRAMIARGFRSTASLAKTPEIKNMRILAAQEIMTQSVTSALFGRPALYPFIILTQNRLGLRHGSSKDFALFSAVFGIVWIGVLNNLKLGADFAELGLKLMERYESKAIKAKLYLVEGYFLRPWKYPFEDSQKYMVEGYDIAREAGDLEYMVYCRTAWSMVEFLRGVELGELGQRMRKYDAEAVKLQQQNARGYFMPVAQMVLNLQGQSADPTHLVGEIFNVDVDLPRFIEVDQNFNGALHAHISQSFLSYLFRDFEKSQSHAAEAQKYLEANPAGQFLPIYYSTRALALLATCDQVDAGKKRKHLKIVNGCLKLLKKWAQANPANYGHLYILVEAEKARALDQQSRAIKYFDQAIQQARENGFIQYESLGNELAAHFYLKLGNEKVARTYLTDARYGYSRWGATAKVQDIDKRHASIVRKILSAERVATGGTTGTGMTTVGTATGTGSGTGAESTSSFDINTVMRATEALSGEIFMDQLLRKVLEMVVQNAGAQRAALILEAGGKLCIEAETSVGQTEPRIMQSIPVDSDDFLPQSIVEYVKRTGENVVLGDAAREGRFVKNSYIQANQTKSVLCGPMVRQGRMVGILYLENNITTNAFTPQRLEVLKILSTQAAISLENARLVAQETERQKLQKEMEMAKAVQMSILPRNLEDEDYIIAAHMTPADQVGGDYYDYYRMNGHRWIAIGDVTGHGLNSGLLMLMAQTGFSTYLNSTSAPDTIELFATLNKTLHMNMAERTKQNLYMTFTALRADSHGNFEHVGKHEDILVWRKATGKVEVVQSDGVWMGIVPEVTSMISKSNFNLAPGDFMTLFTDGVIECRNSSNQQFDTKRLVEVIEASASGGVEVVKDNIVKSCFEFMSRQDDDVTLFLMQKK